MIDSYLFETFNPEDNEAVAKRPGGYFFKPGSVNPSDDFTMIISHIFILEPLERNNTTELHNYHTEFQH